MFYREAGDFKTSYAKDQQTFPIRLDRYFVWGVLAVAFLIIPFIINCLLYTSPSPRDKRQSRMPSSA